MNRSAHLQVTHKGKVMILEDQIALITNPLELQGCAIQYLLVFTEKATSKLLTELVEMRGMMVMYVQKKGFLPYIHQ